MSEAGRSGVANGKQAGEHHRVRAGHGSVGVEALAGDGGARQIGIVVSARQDQILNRLPVPAGVLRLKKGRHARHVGSGHRGAAFRSISAARKCTENCRARRSEVNGAAPEIRKRGQGIRPRRGRHRDHIGEAVVRGIVGVSVVVVANPVQAPIAGRGDEKDSSLALAVDGVIQCLRIPSPAPTVVRGDDIDAAIFHVGDVVQAGCGVGIPSAPIGPQEFAGHDADGPVDPDHAHTVVPDRADGSGGVRAVTVIVERIAVVVVGVDSMAIVGPAVVVIIRAVDAAIARVLPDVRGQVFVVVINARVDIRDDHAAAARAQVPGFRRVDICVDRPTLLPGVIQPPKLRERRVVRADVSVDDVVRFGVKHIGIPLVSSDGFFHRQARWNAHLLEPLDGSVGPQHVGSDPGVDRLDPSAGNSGSKSDQQLVGLVLRTVSRMPPAWRYRPQDPFT